VVGQSCLELRKATASQITDISVLDKISYGVIQSWMSVLTGMAKEETRGEAQKATAKS
jgi:hypothetical protein